MREHHKKESPILSLLGMGGGGTGNILGGVLDLGPLQATGGTTSTPGDGYKYHDFPNAGNYSLSISDGQATVEVMMQGAGGGGGGGRGNSGNNSGGGGGNGGGTLNISMFLQGAMTCPIAVGSGGPAGGNSQSGTNGGNSVFTTPYGAAYGRGGNGGLGGQVGGTPATPTSGSNSVGPPDHTAIDNHQQPAGGGAPSGTGGSGSQAAGDPEASKWWYPYIQPGEGGAGAPHSGSGQTGNLYGGGGGGGPGSWDGGSGQPGHGGARGRVVLRYLITN